MFCLPAVWLPHDDGTATLHKRFIFTVLLSAALGIFSLYIYARLGASQHLNEYYLPVNQQQLSSQAEIRPLYARIQRELVKSKLGLQAAQQNIDLILNFANAHDRSTRCIWSSDG